MKEKLQKTAKLVKVLRRKTHTIRIWKTNEDKPFWGQVTSNVPATKGLTVGNFTDLQYQMEDALTLAKDIANDWDQ